MSDIEKEIHQLLHSNKEKAIINGKVLEVISANPERPYIEHDFGRYEKANSNSPGRAGRLVLAGNEITICMFTHTPWKLLINGESDAI